MKALKEGTSKLTVRLLARGYEHIKSADITLTIVDPFVIVPNDPVYESAIEEYQNQISILPTCQFNFKLQYVIKQDDNGMSYEDIEKGSKKYNWTLDTKMFGSINI